MGLLKAIFNLNNSPNIINKSKNKLIQSSHLINELDIQVYIKKSLEKIANLYRGYTTVYNDQSINQQTIISKINPLANPHTCPYCLTVYSFKAIRARKCPNCNKIMIVRKGMFLTKEQTEEIEKLSTKLYDKLFEVNKLKSLIASVQRNLIDRNYLNAFLEIAEAYQTCAIILNQKYERGFTAWDFAWGTLNKAIEITQFNNEYTTPESHLTDLTEISFARAMHSIREMKYSEKEEDHNKYARLAVYGFYTYLFDLAKFKIEGWHVAEAVRLIHIAAAFGKLKGEEIYNIGGELKSKNLLKPECTESLNAYFQMVRDYIQVETDKEKLLGQIY